MTSPAQSRLSHRPPEGKSARRTPRLLESSHAPDSSDAHAPVAGASRRRRSRSRSGCGRIRWTSAAPGSSSAANRRPGRPAVPGNICWNDEDRCVFAVKGGDRTPYRDAPDPTASPPSFTWGQNGGVSYVGSYRLHKDELVMIFTIGGRLGTARPTSGGVPRTNTSCAGSGGTEAANGRSPMRTHVLLVGLSVALLGFAPGPFPPQA